ncbi:MAG: acyl-CoA dehydrogenase family protein, partial [Bdellovibrionota bacterium]
TRVYNSICALGHWRRALQLAHSYSDKRIAFGKRISEQPLHKRTLQNLEAEFAKAFHLTFYVAHLLGKDEVGTASENEKVLLRALTPIIKLYTAKRCMEAVSEVVEIFGGVGYIEDSGIPTLFRDAQVFSIWEGTTNVLSLDFLRAIEKENAGPVIFEVLKTNFAQALKDPLIAGKLNEIQSILSNKNREELEAQARVVSFLVADVFSLALLMANE